MDSGSYQHVHNQMKYAGVLASQNMFANPEKYTIC